MRMCAFRDLMKKNSFLRHWICYKWKYVHAKAVFNTEFLALNVSYILKHAHFKKWEPPVGESMYMSRPYDN